VLETAADGVISKRPEAAWVPQLCPQRHQDSVFLLAVSIGDVSTSGLAICRVRLQLQQLWSGPGLVLQLSCLAHSQVLEGRHCRMCFGSSTRSAMRTPLQHMLPVGVGMWRQSRLPAAVGAVHSLASYVLSAYVSKHLMACTSHHTVHS
jgi:hypothetical protein